MKNSAPRVVYSTASVTPSTTASARVSRRQTPATSRAQLTLDVPEDAIVYLVGQRMTLTGTQRTYRLPELTEGKTYDYPIKVEVVRLGKTVSVEHNESVSAGVTSSVLVVEQAGQLIATTREDQRLVAENR